MNPEEFAPKTAGNGLSADDARRAVQQGIHAAGPVIHSTPPVRQLPHSIEAEENLISACLLDGADMVGRCIEAGISNRSFYDDKHGIVFEELTRMHAASLPIEAATLAEQLRDHRLLDQVGGFSFVTQVSSALPTTATAAFFVKKVREFEIVRETIRVATSLVEEAFGIAGPIGDFCDEQLGRLTRVLNPTSGEGSTALLARAFAIEVDPAHPPPDDRPIFYIKDKLSSTTSNLTVLAGRAKTAKTAIIGAMTAACVVAEGLSANPDADTLGIRSTAPGGRAVVILDTEQSPAHSTTNLRRILTRVGLTAEQKPKWLRVFPLAGWSAKELTAVLPVLLKAAAKTHGGIHAVFLDGGADFARDVNSSEEAANLCATWHALAIAHACVIVIIIHTNESRQADDIARGWLGKQLRRKAESNLNLKRDGDVLILYGEDGQRHAPIFERDGPKFSWSTEHNMHMSNVGWMNPKLAAKIDKLRDITDAAFVHAGKDALRYSDLVKAICETTGISSDHASTRLTEMKKTGLISKDLIGLWRKTTSQG